MWRHARHVAQKWIWSKLCLLLISFCQHFWVPCATPIGPLVPNPPDGPKRSNLPAVVYGCGWPNVPILQVSLFATFHATLLHATCCTMLHDVARCLDKVWFSSNFRATSCNISFVVWDVVSCCNRLTTFVQHCCIGACASVQFKAPLAWWVRFCFTSRWRKAGTKWMN